MASLASYEGLFVLDPELPESALIALQQSLAEQITKAGGAVDRQQVWGRRRLAYRLGKRRDGVYVLLMFQAPPSAIAPLEGWCAVNESVLRRLIVKAPAPAAAPQPVEAARRG